MGRVEFVIEARVLREWIDLAIHDLIEVDVGDVQFVGSYTKGSRVLE